MKLYQDYDNKFIEELLRIGSGIVWEHSELDISGYDNISGYDRAIPYITYNPVGLFERTYNIMKHYVHDVDSTIYQAISNFRNHNTNYMHAYHRLGTIMGIRYIIKIFIFKGRWNQIIFSFDVIDRMYNRRFWIQREL